MVSMSPRARRGSVPNTVILLFLLTLVSAGCASTKVKPTQKADPNQVVRPSVVFVYRFATSETDLVLDTFGPAFISGTGSPENKLDEAHTVSRILAEELVKQLNDRGITAKHATYTDIPPLTALLVKGQFLTINEGSRAKRMTIGLGAGASKTVVQIQVYQVTEYGPRRVAAAEATAQGSRTPGMAIPVGAGAAMGRAATSAIISGGMNVAREVKGAMSEDAVSIAKKIADRAENFYKKQGWL